MNVIDETNLAVQPFEVQAQLFKMLTHPVRLAILNLLRDGEHCVCHMEAYLGYRQAYISQQIAVLREAKLIQDRRDGWNIFYRITDPRIFLALDTIKAMSGQENSQMKTDVVCPCPHCSAARIV